ncbi:unnamed protein product [Ectocarpus sp. 12 AP-2014]
MDNHNSLHLRVGSRTDTPRSGKEQQGAEASLYLSTNLLRFSASNRALHTRSHRSYFYTCTITDWQISRIGIEREQRQGQNTETSSIKRGATNNAPPPPASRTTLKKTATPKQGKRTTFC